MRAHKRIKHGKTHAYYSLVENHRCARGQLVQSQVLYLGEIDQAKRVAVLQAAQAIDPPHLTTPCLPSLAQSSPPVDPALPLPQVKLSEFSLHRPRQWGACWIASRLWGQLHLTEFWRSRLPPSREGTR